MIRSSLFELWQFSQRGSVAFITKFCSKVWSVSLKRQVILLISYWGRDLPGWLFSLSIPRTVVDKCSIVIQSDWETRAALRKEQLQPSPSQQFTWCCTCMGTFWLAIPWWTGGCSSWFTFFSVDHFLVTVFVNLLLKGMLIYSFKFCTSWLSRVMGSSVFI